MRNLSLGRRHLVNAYEVEAGIGVIARNAVWSMPERRECEVLQKARYINTSTFTFLPLFCVEWDVKHYYTIPSSIVFRLLVFRYCSFVLLLSFVA